MHAKIIFKKMTSNRKTLRMTSVKKLTLVNCKKWAKLWAASLVSLILWKKEAAPKSRLLLESDHFWNQSRFRATHQLVWRLAKAIRRLGKYEQGMNLLASLRVCYRLKKEAVLERKTELSTLTRFFQLQELSNKSMMG